MAGDGRSLSRVLQSDSLTIGKLNEVIENHRRNYGYAKIEDSRIE